MYNVQYIHVHGQLVHIIGELIVHMYMYMNMLCIYTHVHVHIIILCV